MPKLFSLSKHTACLLSVTAALALSVPSAHGDGYFNNFYGKCDGAAYRLKLIKDSLVGSWNFSEDYSESGGTEYYTSSDGDDKEKDCEDCCVASSHNEGRLELTKIDSFGNIEGTIRVQR